MFNLFKKKEVINLGNEFNNLMLNIVFPIFKKNNFRKQANHFSRKINDITQTFNIQKSQWNSKENISFTFNIGFYSEKIFKDIRGSNTPDFPKTYDSFIYIRAGHLVYGNDKWFDVSQNTDFLQLEKEILKVVNEVVNLFNSYTTLISLKDITSKYGSIGAFSGFEKASFFVSINEKEEAQKILKELYTDALNPRPSTMTILNPDGSVKEETIYPIDYSIQKKRINKYKDFANKHSLKLEYPL